MTKAVDTSLSFVRPIYPPELYRSFWDLVCHQLFVETPPGLDTEGAIGDTEIWQQGEITMTVTSSPYTFTIEIETLTPPQKSDFIFYKDKFYLIGAVSASGNVYTCTNCILVDVAIMSLYADLLGMKDSITTANTEYSEAEDARVLAESARQEAEGQRELAESARQSAYVEAEAGRDGLYATAESARNTAFDAAEAGREAYLDALIAPWIVPGAVFVGTNLFVSDDEQDTPQEGYTKWHAGQRVYLKSRTNRIEEILADDGEYLITLSGWKWKYSEE